MAKKGQKRPTLPHPNPPRTPKMTFLGPPVYVLKGSWLKMPNLGLLVKPIRAFLQKSPKMGIFTPFDPPYGPPGG